MYKLTLISLLLLIVILVVFTVPSWQALLMGEDGYGVVMTSVMGRFEQIGDVIVMTVSILLGIVSAIWLFKFIYF